MDKEKIFRKLHFATNKKSLVLNAPVSYQTLLSDEEVDTVMKVKSGLDYEFIQVFAIEQSELEAQLKLAQLNAKHDAIFWACYPKKTGKIKSNIQRETVWEALHLIGLKAVTAVSIDDTWSALRARPYDAVGK